MALKNMSRQIEPLCEYEKKRMKILESNAEKMKAKGYGTLANKILKEKYERVARGVNEASSEDMDCQFEPNVVSNLQSVDSSLNHHELTPLNESNKKLSMAELGALKRAQRQKKQGWSTTSATTFDPRTRFKE